MTVTRNSPTVTADTPPRTSTDAWSSWAIEELHAEANRVGETNLLTVDLPAEWGVRLYLKDESAHPTGSLKHRLARSLFIYAICNGWIGASTTIVEASSGSTAVSEAYFARLLGLPFVAVIPSSTSADKIVGIERFGGRCHLVEQPSEVPTVAARLADEVSGRYMNQFRYAERASDWRGPDTIAQAVFDQLAREPHPEPSWVVVGAGTGGTAATFGRYVRWTGARTRVCVVDPPGSVLIDCWRAVRDQGRSRAECGLGAATGSSVIEGIGRPRHEESFLPWLVDAMLTVPDAASAAALNMLQQQGFRRPGGSTGTNLIGAFAVIAEMIAAGESGSVVSVICDSGEKYRSTLSSPDWVSKNLPDTTQWVTALSTFMTTAQFPLRVSHAVDRA